MPCALKKTFEADRHSGNAVLALVKGNQLNLLETVRDIASQQSPLDGCRKVERIRHGRQEHRDVEVFDIAGHVDPDWNGRLVTAARITCMTWHKDTKSGLWHATDVTFFYV
jgi:hypothetical protein